ncbi:MAG: lipocalin family protein [Flavobacterium sp.]
MKKFICIIVVAFAFGSCSNDDNNKASGTILGKWNYNKVSATINGQLEVGNYPGNEEGCPKDFLNFRENGTVGSNNYKKTNLDCDLEVIDGTYAVSNNSVSVSIDGGNFSGEITKLTSTEMIVKGTLGDLQNVTFSFIR